MIRGHGGNIYDLAQELGCAPSDIVDMSSNVNPFGPPPGLLSFLAENIDRAVALPEVDAARLRHAFADQHGIDPVRVLAGNGSTQFIYCLPRALESRRVLILAPTYADYADACRMNGVPFDFLTTDEASGFGYEPDRVAKAVAASGADTVFICNPNNPTGVMMSPQAIAGLCHEHPQTRFILDESYLGFVPQARALSLMDNGAPDNLVVLNSMSKLFRIPGLRIGFVYSSRAVIDSLDGFSLPWSVNSLSQAAVAWLMENSRAVSRFVAETVAALDAEKAFLSDQLKPVAGIELFPSVTSFMLAALGGTGGAEEICRYLGRHHILIRNCANFHGLSSRYVRFSLKTHSENISLVEKLHYYFDNKELK